MGRAMTLIRPPIPGSSCPKAMSVPAAIPQARKLRDSERLDVSAHGDVGGTLARAALSWLVHPLLGTAYQAQSRKSLHLTLHVRTISP